MSARRILGRGRAGSRRLHQGAPAPSRRRRLAAAPPGRFAPAGAHEAEIGKRAAQHEDYAAAATAKLAASEAVVDTATDALRLVAGSAWLDSALDFRATLTDVAGSLFASGTSEVQLDVLARDLESEHRRT